MSFARVCLPHVLAVAVLPIVVTVAVGATRAPARTATASFHLVGTFDAGPSPAGIAVGDFNNDGILDLVVPNDTADPTQATHTILYGGGLGGFAAPQSAPADPAAGSALAVGELTGTAPPLIVVSNRDAGKVYIYDQLANLGTESLGDTPVALLVGQFGGGTLSDIVVANRDANTITDLPRDLTGFGTPFTCAVGASPIALAAYGLHVLVANHLDHSLSHFAGMSPGATAQSISVQVSPTGLAVADLNGDGRPDVVVTGGDPGPGLSILYDTGAVDATLAQFTEVIDPPTSGTELRSPVLADLDGDGYPDLALASFDANHLDILFNDGHGGFSAPIHLATGSGPNGVAVGDFNGDGAPDIAVSNFYDNTVSIYLNEGAPTPALLLDFDAQWQGSAVELRWAFDATLPPGTLTVERATDLAGPWIAVAGAPRLEGGQQVLVDAEAVPGAHAFYRLRLALTRGGTQIFGPVEVTGTPHLTLALAPAQPNPARARDLAVRFTLASAAPARIALIDAAGRQVAGQDVSALGVGDHTWTPAAGRSLGAGLYFVRLEQGGQAITRRVAVVD